MLTRPTLLLLCLACAAAAPPGPGPEPEPDPALARLRLALNPELPAWSPGYVVERCAEHLSMVPPESKPFVRYFDGSAAPRALLPALTAALAFGCNSASSATVVSVPQPVPHADNRLFWIDLRWYRWTPEVWEQVAGEDPYFREPLVPSASPGLATLKATSGNAVVRAGWFLAYTFDTTQFLKGADTKADDAFYYKLVYGTRTEEVTERVTVERATVERRSVPVRTAAGLEYREQDVTVTRPVVETRKTVVTRAAVPQTAAEFERFWKVDTKLLEEFPLDQGAVVDEGRSGVSLQNRTIWRVRTAIGSYWRTFDVLRSAGDQDFLENPFPREFDAGEHIALDAKGAQHYLLTNGKGERVEFGDPRVVHDTASGNKVLLTAASCIHCHDAGILPVRNELEKIVELGADLKAYGPERALRLKQFYFGDLPRLIRNDQADYAAFVARCNGLSPQQNAAAFGRARSWYAQPVTLEQAAREIGCAPRELADALSVGTKGRLGRLALDGTPVPRTTWERGGYQEAFLLVLEARKRAGKDPARSP
jgi:hypothetical protein